MKLILALVVLWFGFGLTAGLPVNIQGFAAWSKVATGLPSSGEHKGKSKVVYANAVATKAWSGNAVMPVGSLVVKAPGDPKTAKWVAVMQKTAKGWNYQEFVAKGQGYVASSEMQSECVECHSRAKAKDFLFSRK